VTTLLAAPPPAPPPAATRVAAQRDRLLAEKAARGPATTGAHALLTTYRSLRASEGLPRRVRRGLQTRDRLAALEFVVDPDDLLAGRPRFSRDYLPVAQGGPLADAEYAAAGAYLEQFGPEPGQTGHCEVDRSAAFKLGLDGLRADLEARAAQARGARQESYQAFALAVGGLSTMIEHAAAAVEAALPSASPARRAELAAIAAACRQVAHQPPTTFREALQLLWCIDLGIQFADRAGLVGPGHLDRTLRAFYDADLAAGHLTADDALALLEALYLLVNHSIPDGLAMPVMVGGRDARGRDQTHPLSYLCLEALRRTRLVYPTVGICWHPGTPRDLTALAVELIAAGYPTPALFGDETIQRGLRHYGVPPRESHLYINSTCVEITPVGGSNVWVASPYFSTCQILLEELAAQAAAGPRAAATFEEFFAAYLRRLAGRIAHEGVVPQNGQRQLRRLHGGKPLQSVFTRDCVARGKDIDEGGARYNWVECSFVGLANLVDSLVVIREQVYRRRALTLMALREVLDANFAGHEALRLQFLNAHPKYGNAQAEVDSLLPPLLDRLRQECAKYRMLPDDSPFIPGAFCWVMHERLGCACGATPDGRLAGQPFADGGGPAQGRELHGPTAAIVSTTSWDHAPLIGGVAFNLKFSRALFTTPAAVDRLHELLLTYLRRGGFEVQVNVVDRAVLERALAHPEQYRDLVVRIGGYTDYFTRLSPAMQAEVMARTEFTQS
jgi:formate C-acetyltransferase